MNQPQRLPPDPDAADHHEPRDGYAAVPMWLTLTIVILLFWGIWYLLTYSGGFSGSVLDDQPPRDGLTNAPLDFSNPRAAGQILYAQHCATCHSANGQGQEGLYPPLAGSEWVTGAPWRLRRIALQGPTGPIDVAGKRYNSDAMPAFGPQLSDQAIAAILTYIRTAWGNSASPVAPDEVAATRHATAGRTAAWTASELLSITADDYTPPATSPATAPATQSSRGAP